MDVGKGLPVREHSGVALASRSPILWRFDEIVAYIYLKRENSCKIFGSSADLVIILSGSSYQPRAVDLANDDPYDARRSPYQISLASGPVLGRPSKALS
jgi:hypothetical protein